jgi:hypothetical protein
LNYFNYFTEIEDAFVRRRGKHLFLSSLDWALMETWKQQGIPLHIVLRGVERSFDSYESRPRKRTVKTLLYCQEEVEAQYAEWLEARVGASEQTDDAETDQTRFSATAIREHLTGCRNELQRVSELRKEDDLSEALARAATLLQEIYDDVAENAALDTRRLEGESLRHDLDGSWFALTEVVKGRARRNRIEGRRSRGGVLKVRHCCRPQQERRPRRGN